MSACISRRLVPTCGRLIASLIRDEEKDDREAERERAGNRWTDALVVMCASKNQIPVRRYRYTAILHVEMFKIDVCFPLRTFMDGQKI